MWVEFFSICDNQHIESGYRVFGGRWLGCGYEWQCWILGGVAVEFNFFS